MEEKFGKMKSCIILNVIAIVMSFAALPELSDYWDGGIVGVASIGITYIGITAYMWGIYYMLIYGAKLLILRCKRDSVIWLLSGIYIAIMAILVWCRFEAYLFSDNDTYKAMVMVVVVGLYPMLISTLMEFYHKFEKDKLLLGQIIIIMGALAAFNFVLLQDLNFINYVIVGIVQAFVIGKAVSNMQNKYIKISEFITVAGIIIIWVTAIFNTRIDYGSEVFTDQIWKYATYYGGLFIDGIANIFVVRNIIYISIVAAFFVVLYKLLLIGNKKSRCFYLSYKVAWKYLIIKYMVVLFFTIAVGGVENYWSSEYMLVDMMAMAIIIYSSQDEYDMWREQETIQSKKLIEAKDVFGEAAGDTFILLKMYDYECISSIKDNKTGNVEMFESLPGYTYKDKDYAMLSPIDNREEVLVLEYRSIEGEDIEDEYEEGVKFVFCSVEEELCEELYEKYKHAMMNRVADEYYNV